MALLVREVAENLDECCRDLLQDLEGTARDWDAAFDVMVAGFRFASLVHDLIAAGVARLPRPGPAPRYVPIVDHVREPENPLVWLTALRKAGQLIGDPTIEGEVFAPTWERWTPTDQVPAILGIQQSGEVGIVWARPGHEAKLRALRATQVRAAHDGVMRVLRADAALTTHLRLCHGLRGRKVPRRLEGAAWRWVASSYVDLDRPLSEQRLRDLLRVTGRARRTPGVAEARRVVHRLRGG